MTVTMTVAMDTTTVTTMDTTMVTPTAGANRHHPGNVSMDETPAD